MQTPSVLWGAVLGFLAVALGAFGAHGLEEVLAEGERAEWWATAVQYHLAHALALLMTGLVAEHTGRGRGAMRCFLLGTAVFRKNRDFAIVIAIISCMVAAWGSHAVGLSPALGAFLAGLVLARVSSC